MISTRLHACIDYGVASLFGAVARRSTLSGPVSQAFGAAGVYHTSYSLATDYELGARPWLTMRQHLMLDAVGAAALVAAGVLLRRQPPLERALLISAGIAEFMVIANSEQARPAEMSVSYPPLDTPKPIADDVFIVDSTMPGLIGRVLPVRMTVIRLPDGALLLHSPTRYSPALAQALEQIGPIRHLVAPNIAHWTLLKPWQDAFPQATTWAAPGLRDRRQVRRSGLRLDHDLGPEPPPAWGNNIALRIIPGAAGFHEVAMFHRPSGTLVLTDLVLNLEPPKLPALARPIMRLFGSLAPDGMPPPYLRLAVHWRRADARAAVRELLQWQPQRVVFSHGRWFNRDATQHLRRSMRWLLA
ncbi:MAG: DUF4336 domain-containing protein [Rhodopila sp.]